MFDDLDATLHGLLADSAAPAALHAATIDFATPDREYKPSQPTLNLFLHDVGENRALRDQAPWRTGDQTIVTSAPPALRVDCTYLITGWSNKTGGVKTAEEHRLLALALTWLGRFPVIADNLLKGSLANPPQPYPVCTFVAQTQEGQQMGHFWSALGIAPRPAFSLTVTLTLQPFDKVETFPVARDFRVQTGFRNDPRLAGRVLDNTLAPVPGAVVTADGNASVTAGPGGDFKFDGLSFGRHALRARAPDLLEVERVVTYSEEDQIHNLIMTRP